MLIIYGFTAIAGLLSLIVFNRLPEEKQMVIIRQLTRERIKDGIRKTEPAGDVQSMSMDF